MNWHDDYFSPEHIDEQIDQLLHESQESSPPVRIVHELHELTGGDIPRLARIRERLAVHAASHEQEKSPISIQHYQQPIDNRTFTAPQEAPHARKPRDKRRMTWIFAGLVAMLVLASMIAILAFIKPASVRQPTQSGTPVSSNRMSPAYYGSKLYTIYRADANTGHIVWRFHVPNGTTPDPKITVDQDTVYFVSNSRLYALDGAKGKVRWTYSVTPSVPDWMLSRMMISNGILYEELNNKLYGINTADGKLVRTYTLPLQIFASEVVLADNVIYARGGYELCAFDLGQGKVVWDKQLPQKMGNQPLLKTEEDAFSNLQVRDGVIAMAVYDETKSAQNEYTRYIVAYDTRTGAQLWKSDETIVSFPKKGILLNGNYTFTLAHGVVYYRTPASNVVHAYDVHARKELWQKDTGLPTEGELQTDGDAIYQLVYGSDPNVPNGTYDRHAVGVVALDARKGTVRWQFPTERQQMQNNPQSYEKPILQNGLVYINIHPNVFHTEMTTYAFTPQGQLLWHTILY